MDIQVKSIIDKLPEYFVSNAHSSQNRIFGFITTNIRSISTISGYIKELLPEWIERKDDYSKWEAWFKNKDVQEKHKQKFKRLEIAKILFRNVKDSPKINTIGEKLYRIYKQNDINTLTFILNLYLLTGHYFDQDNQPLVEINKVLNIAPENFVELASQELLNEDYIGRFTLSMLFYNPSISESLDISYALIQNKVSESDINFLVESLEDRESLIYKRKYNAGGISNFKKELAVVLNYYFFKLATEKYCNDPQYDLIIEEYIDSIFKYNLDKFFNIKEKQNILDVLLDSSNKILLKDFFELDLGVEFDNKFVKRKRKNLKQAVLERFDYKCFFDHYAENENDHLAHSLNYFKTKGDKIYLEGHHMIQMENSKFFEKDVDVEENIIPLCPNCHRKIHNGDKATVLKMLNEYYKNSNKQALMRKGIFVDIETLERFYGIEGD